MYYMNQSFLRIFLRRENTQSLNNTHNSQGNNTQEIVVKFLSLALKVHFLLLALFIYFPLQVDAIEWSYMGSIYRLQNLSS